MTTFIYEIEATKNETIINLGEAESVEQAFATIKNANIGGQTLITIQKLEIVSGRHDANSFNHVETFEFETV